VDLLAAALAGQSDGSWQANQAEAEAIPENNDKCPQDATAIRLQDVVEIITNGTARALNLLAKQSTKMHNAIYQNHLTLDYLLSSEGGVCGKFNLSNCGL
jgi:hypothetical protein